MIMGKPKSRVANAIVPGPLEQYAPGFREWLLERGYTPLTAVLRLQLMAHVSKWMEREGLELSELTGSAAGRFLAARLAAGYREPRSLAGLRPLLDYLDGLGLLPPESPAPEPDAAGALICEFAEYLRAERGLAPMTVAAYSSRAARFVARYAPGGDPGVIMPGDVTSAVLAETSGLSAGAGQHLACALRAFLRYCHVQGLVTADVSAAAMGVTGRRTTMLPRGLEPGQVGALLAACDRGDPAGRRNYAVIMLLARLGLRAGEAARLRLDDINCRSAEIGIRGKGGQYDILPLPADAGAAIAAWLRDGRPAVGSREVFTTVTAPTRPLTREAVGWIVRRGCIRAGIGPFGPHRLRHTAACAMIAAKVPLAGIAQAMRHRSHGVTAIYARAGLDRLRPLARPWPGAQSLPEGPEGPEGEAS
jgi:integrase/recombinase XerD